MMYGLSCQPMPEVSAEQPVRLGISASGIGSSLRTRIALAQSEIGVREWATRALARSQVFRWIAGYYNRRRLHSTIEYLTPMQARVRYGQPVALAA